MFKTQTKCRTWNAGAYITMWRDIRPTNGTAYLYETEEAARLACERSNDGSRTWDDYRIVDLAHNREC